MAAALSPSSLSSAAAAAVSPSASSYARRVQELADKVDWTVRLIFLHEIESNYFYAERGATVLGADSLADVIDCSNRSPHPLRVRIGVLAHALINPNLLREILSLGRRSPAEVLYEQVLEATVEKISKEQHAPCLEVALAACEFVPKWTVDNKRIFTYSMRRDLRQSRVLQSMAYNVVVGKPQQTIPDMIVTYNGSEGNRENSIYSSVSKRGAGACYNIRALIHDKERRTLTCHENLFRHMKAVGDLPRDVRIFRTLGDAAFLANARGLLELVHETSQEREKHRDHASRLSHVRVRLERQMGTLVMQQEMLEQHANRVFTTIQAIFSECTKKNSVLWTLFGRPSQSFCVEEVLKKAVNTDLEGELTFVGGKERDWFFKIQAVVLRLLTRSNEMEVFKYDLFKCEPTAERNLTASKILQSGILNVLTSLSSEEPAWFV